MNLNKDLQDIDELLSKREIPIYARPIHAVMEFGKKHKILLPLTPSNYPQEVLPYPKEYEKHTDYIHKWYDKKYGERIKHDFSPGKLTLLIKNIPWQMTLPLVYGAIIPIIDISLKNNHQNISRGPIEFNILTCIENMTQNLARELNETELKYISKRFIIGMYVCNDISDRYRKQFISQAHSDLLASVDYLMRGKLECGQSRWSSLQFCEKYIKAILVDRTIDFPNTHILSRLLNLLPDIDINNYLGYIGKIQCSAGIRYGEETSGVKQAIEAHENAVNLVLKLKGLWIN